jgi:hypothetical protein
VRGRPATDLAEQNLEDAFAGKRSRFAIPATSRATCGRSCATARALDPPMQRVLRALAAQSSADRAFAEQVRERFLAHRPAALGSVLQRAVERGELSPERAAIALDLVFGSLWYRLVFAIGPLDRAWADAVADAVAAIGR